MINRTINYDVVRMSLSSALSLILENKSLYGLCIGVKYDCFLVESCKKQR